MIYIELQIIKNSYFWSLKSRSCRKPFVFTNKFIQWLFGSFGYAKNEPIWSWFVIVIVGIVVCGQFTFSQDLKIKSWLWLLQPCLCWQWYVRSWWPAGYQTCQQVKHSTLTCYQNKFELRNLILGIHVFTNISAIFLKCYYITTTQVFGIDYCVQFKSL